MTIAENGITAQFIYEAGNDRTKMSVTNNGALVLNRYYLGDQYELDEKPGQTREKLYLGGDYYSAGAVLVRNNGGAWQLFYINSDYLGSITHIVNAAGSVVAEYSYDAWGKLRDANTLQVYAIGHEPELFLGRGYTGHEHLPWFELINMNARLYDPVHGRFLAPDPYVQAPDMTQSFNRYSYVLNNPMVYYDKDGEFWWIAVLAFLFFTEPGYQIQKYISPVAIKVDIHLGTHQRGIGINTSVGIPKLVPYSKRWENGITYFWKNYGDYKGWETRKGSEQSILGVYHWGKTEYQAGEFSQTVGFKSFGIPAVLGADISNDLWGDEGDRYRTSHQRINFFGLSIGGSVFTGDPSLLSDDRRTQYEYRAKSKEYYVKGPYGDPDKYRHGILYVGFGPFKVGWDSEGIRHVLQNRIGHDIISPESPWFKYIRYRPKPYIQFGWNGLW